MKKVISCLLVLCMMMIGSSAFALNYQRQFTNEATFETLEEARVNQIDFLNGATGRTYVADPALDSYPVNTTYVYRSANTLTSMSAAPRMSTNLLVYTDAVFASKGEALAYLTDMGLTEIINEAVGSIVLVTPSDPTAGFGLADQMAFYQLQSAMCNVGFSMRDESGSTYYADNAYYGGVTYRYLIGIGSGATFINDYIAGTTDYISRIAGLLLVGGDMARISEVADFVPTYLVNPSDETVEKYKAANDVDACGFNGDVTYYYNQAQPLQKVYVENADSVDLKTLVSKAYYDMFINALRVPVIKPNLYTASTAYASYNWNAAPYSLGERNAIISGVTVDGVYVVEHQEDRFKDIVTERGDYLDTWYELLPDEVLNNTAPAGTVPLVLANHGGGDDPLQYLDEIGLINLVGEERFAIVAPYHSNAGSVLPDVLPKLAQYMLDTYPALDASRVYVTGYSMGGRATLASLCGDASLFAAAVPQGAVTYLGTPEQDAQYANVDIPIMFMTSTYDFHIDEPTLTMRLSYYFGMQSITFDYTTLLNMYLGFNEMEPVAFDFDAYPMSGFKSDLYVQKTLNNEYTNHTWMLLNDAGVPMVGLNITEFLPHGLYQEYAELAWDFLKHYTRNTETGEISYNPYN